MQGKQHRPKDPQYVNAKLGHAKAYTKNIMEASPMVKHWSNKKQAS
jgi:hypothetical protein